MIGLISNHSVRYYDFYWCNEIDVYGTYVHKYRYEFAAVRRRAPLTAVANQSVIGDCSDAVMANQRAAARQLANQSTVACAHRL